MRTMLRLIVFLYASTPVLAGFVTCGSMVKLQHKDTGFHLNSETKNMNAGSGQQIVTFVKDPATHNTLWWIRPANHREDENAEYPHHATCQLAEPVACGTVIRLTHADTMRNLHSHNVQSVLSRQQEVTAFGEGDGRGDGGDDWMVLCETASVKQWKHGDLVRLQHQDTGAYLGSSNSVEFNVNNCGQNCPLMNHLEAFGRTHKDNYSLLYVEQGIHLSK